MKKAALALLLAAIGTIMIAAKPAPPVIKGRIDIQGKMVLKPGKATMGTVKNIHWGKEQDRAQSLTSESDPLSRNKWTKVSLSFTPQADGTVSIQLMSNWSKSGGKKDLNAHWVIYDNVEVKGATIKNGDFEKADKGKPAGWWSNTLNYITGKAGEAKVKAWHNSRVGQTIAVKKGQEVTITYEAKAGEFEEAKK